MNRLLDVARAILKGEVDLIDGACEIVSLSHGTPFANDPIFHGFIAIWSDADDLHTAPSRDWWAPEALERIDKKRREYIESVRKGVLEDCWQLLERFGDPGRLTPHPSDSSQTRP